MWTLAFGHHEDRTPTHGYATRGRDGGVREIVEAGVSMMARVRIMEVGRRALERESTHEQRRHRPIRI
jgi:hypothetical protein